MSDAALRALERRWAESGDEADRYRWLHERYRLGWGEELAPSLRALEEEVQAVYDDDDAPAACAIGFELSAGDPVARLASFTQRRLEASCRWWPVPAAELPLTLERLLDPSQIVGLYPHRTYRTGGIAQRFSHLFGEGLLFANCSYEGGGGTWSNLFAPLPEWEFGINHAVAGVLGPLVGVISINARESL